MKRLAQSWIAVCLLLALSTSAHAQLSQCSVTATIYDSQGALLSGFRLTVVRVIKNGQVISAAPKIYTTNSSGVATLTLPRASTAYIYANAFGLDRLGSAGVPLYVPDSSSANLEQLANISTLFSSPYQLIYSTSGNVPAALSPNTSTTPKFLGEYGNGTNATNLDWWTLSGASFNTATKVVTISGGSGIAWTSTAYYRHDTVTNYDRSPGVRFLDCDATTGAQSINLGLPDGNAVEARKSDDTSNVVTITFGASTLRLSTPGAWARFIPDGVSSWRIWAYDASGSSATLLGGFAQVPIADSASYTRQAGVSFIAANASAAGQAVTLGTSENTPVDVIKTDSTTNTVTVNYNSTSLTLAAPGAYVKFVPDGSGAWIVWSYDPTGAGVPTSGTYASTTASSYTVPDGVGFVSADSTGSATITLGTPGTVAKEVRKGDTGSGVQTVNYGGGSVALYVAGQTAKFVPNGSSWVLWYRN